MCERFGIISIALHEYVDYLLLAVCRLDSVRLLNKTL